MRIVAAEPLPGEAVQGLRSLDDGFVPEIFDPTLLDDRYVVSNREAVATARDLLEREGIFAGPSSGAILVGRGARRADDGARARSSRCCRTAAGNTSRPGTYTRPLDEIEDALEGGVSWW